MTVYVDDMRASYGRMVMCHMIADSDDELHAMAAQIGVARRWHQALSKRALAVQFGAVEITIRQAAMMNRRRHVTGSLGAPEDAERWFHQYLAARTVILIS